MLRRVLFLFLFGVWTRMGVACPPDLCSCKQLPFNDYHRNSLYYTEVICDGYADSLVSGLDNTTKLLQVSNMNDSDSIGSLIYSLVEDFSNLQTLSIVESAIGNFTFNLDNLQMQTLNLPYNQLEFIPEIIQNKSTLRTLDLSNNALTVLDANPFRTLRTLELLNLSANSLTAIGSDSLTGLINLKCLDLSANNLTQLDDKVLLPVTNLQYLNLSSNKLEVLNEVSFGGLTKLQQLDVSWNRLARVAPGSLELPSLARLLLAGNPGLGGSREVLVGSGHHLQTVDASRTGLKQVPAALTHSIRTLRLAGNSIKIVRCGDLDSYPLLQLLDFTSNEILNVEDDALGRLETLSILYLTDNSINDIPKSLPVQLKVLHLEHNAINKVAGDDLQGLNSLEVLLLNDNKIRVVEQGAFSQLTALVALDLSRNPVTVLEAGCLTGPTALEVLRLSSIGIISLAKDTTFPLSAPERLISLDLSDSPGLARQYLADTAALAASRALQELDVSQTALQFIRSDLLHFLPQLRVLHLKYNQLDCSDLHWLAAWMRSKDLQEYEEIICRSPRDLWGTPLIDLPAKMMTTTTTIKPMHENTIDSPEDPSVEFNYTNLRDLDKIDIRKKTIHFILNDNVASKLNDTVETKFNHSKSNLIAMKKIIVQDYLTNTNPKSKRKKLFVNKELIKKSESNFLALGNITELKQLEGNRPDRDEGLNQTGKVAITETVTTSQDRRHLQANANEYKSPGIKVDAIPAHLFLTTANSSEKESFGSQAMYTTNDYKGGFVHPGMMILGVTLLGMVAVLVMLAAKFTRFRRRTDSQAREDDIEVSSLPGVTELW